MKGTHTLTQKWTATEGRDAEVNYLDIVIVLVVLEKDIIELR